MSGKETQGGDTFVCGRCKKANPRLAEAPFPNDLGRKIHEKRRREIRFVYRRIIEYVTLSTAKSLYEHIP